VARFVNLEPAARRKLKILDAAKQLSDPRSDRSQHERPPAAVAPSVGLVDLT
jgi:hypothetical protein